MSEEDRARLDFFFKLVLKTGSNINVPKGSMEREAAVL